MADDKDSQQSNLPWLALLGLVAAGVTTALYFSPLTSSRPPEPAFHDQRSYGDQTIPARLWQDPFKAVDARVHSPDQVNDGRAHNVQEVTDQIKKYVVDQGHDVLILPVMVPSAPYAELAENRLRVRVAVLEGLARCALLPVDGEHIGYFNCPWEWKSPPTTPPTTQPTDEKQGVMAIPYEWCQKSPLAVAQSTRREAIFNRVLVLWVSEEALSHEPLTRLAWIKNDLMTNEIADAWNTQKQKAKIADQQSGSHTYNPEQRFEFTIIGPRASQTVSAMVEELCKPDHAPDLTGVRMLAPTPTAEQDTLLAGRTRDPDSQGWSLEEWIHKKTQLKFTRTTLTDRDLSHALVDELALRGISARNDHIALVSEWDTFYGRAVPISFAAAASETPASSLASMEGKAYPPNIHPFVYLRGIDGQTPSDASHSDSSSSQGNTDSLQQHKDGEQPKAEAPAESPEGVNQADYLRRLADRLGELDAQLRRQTGSGIRAVGVLGSDVYDKLLVLRALRDRLADPLFFTTAMDVRYLLPSESPAAHNLIVVSPFGLNLGEDFQANIPPFRDSYQTAVFASTLWAVNGLSGHGSMPQLWGPEDNESVFGLPRRFEIGRSKAYDLTLRTSGGSFGEIQPRRLDYASRDDGLADWMGTLLILCLTLASVCVAAIFIGVGAPPRSRVVHFVSMAAARLKTLRDRLRSDRGFRLHSLKLRILRMLVRLKSGDIAKFISSWPFWMGLVTIILALIWIIAPRIQGEAAEPSALVDGVSVWPTESLRFLAVGLSLYFIANGWSEGRKNDREIERKFNLRNLSQACRYKGAFAFPYDTLGRSWRFGKLFIRDWDVFGFRKTKTAEPARSSEKSPQAQVCAQNLWWEYQARRMFWMRTARAGLLSLIYLLFTSLLLTSVFGTTAAPIRGSVCASVDSMAHWLSLLASVFLTFSVIDATYLNSRLITYLFKTDTLWPEDSFEDSRWTSDEEGLLQYMQIRFIAIRTRAVGEIIYYPFVILFLLVVARNSWFDDWRWTPGLVVVTALDFGLATLALMMLRGAVERARKTALHKIRRRKMIVRADEETAKELEDIGDLVQQEKEGAFSILSRHPLLAAILLPSGTVGIWVILEQLSKFMH